MTVDCAAFGELAPELALGIAVGEERAAALDHLVGCRDCRAELARLTATVDALVATAPAAEPPSGFEVRALSTFEPAPVEPRHRAGRVLALAAAIVAFLAIIGVGSAIVIDRGADPSNESAAPTASGSSASLMAPDGSEVGTVRVERTAVEGGPTRSELVVSIDAGAPDGSYRVQCDYESGRPYGAGDIVVGPGGLSRWSATVSVPTYDLRRVRLISTSGDDNLEAEFT